MRLLWFLGLGLLIMIGGWSGHALAIHYALGPIPSIAFTIGGALLPVLTIAIITIREL